MKKNLFSVLILLIYMIAINVHAQSETQKIYLNWQVGVHDSPETEPKKLIPAKVPGAVQLDFAASEKYGPYFYADNWKDYLWMEDKYFTYQAVFSAPKLSAGEKLFFTSKGIDYKFKITINGKDIHFQEGMFTRVQLDITPFLQEKNTIKVMIFPVPKVSGRPADRSQADRSVKPAVSYGWDWHPRLIPSGIWDETFLQVKNQSFIKDIDIQYTLTSNLKNAQINVKVNGENIAGKNLVLTIKNKDGKTIFTKNQPIDSSASEILGTLNDIQLWWPVGQGNPYLYNFVISLQEGETILESREVKTGFRKVRLVMNEGAWDEPKDFPKSRSVPPIQLEINNRKIFCKGTNWVNPEIFPGIITAETYKTLLNKAKEANFNHLRIWGGAIINKDFFYEHCDELGLMVWQDFPLACNEYEGTPEYLKVLEQEAVSIIKRLKPHASLVIWCGGNELFNSWSGMTDQSLALRLLNSKCYELDPHTPFLMTSPLMGIGHGHYLFRDHEKNEEVFQWMPKAKNTAYTEFGMPGPASAEVLKNFIPKEQLFPPKPGTVWETHHAFGSWGKDTWLGMETLRLYFGEAKNLDDLVKQGQWLQSEGYKAIYEEARRQKPYCSMALNWCFNEPWPTAANNSLLSWPAIPKPAFYAVSNACRPILASARIPKFSWKEGEELSIDLWMLNDSPGTVESKKIIAKLIADKEYKLLEWDVPAMAANENASGPTVRFKLPSIQANQIKLLLEVEGHPEYNSEYLLHFKSKEQKAVPATKELNK